MTPETCPNCGADVPRGAKACPECGADEATGWSDDKRYDGLDLPDERFDYGEFVKREFASGGIKPRGLAWLWWFVAVLLVLGFFVLFFQKFIPR